MPPEVQPPTTAAVLLCVLAVLLAAAVFMWRRKAWLVCAGFTAAAAGIGYWTWHVATTGLAVSAGTALGLLAVVGWYRWTRTAGTVSRWGNRARRTAGVATGVEIARVASGPAMRRKATVVRPSLADVTRRERMQTRTIEVAVPLARVGAQRVWASVEDVVLGFGGPRTGKTGWLAGRVIDSPGAALVTSTRTDLHTLTGGLRETRGPVRVFNPGGLGGLTSTVTFDPLTGCADPVHAAARAADMLGAVTTGSGGDREFWDNQARRVLGALLHAAALDGELGMRDVLRWVSDPDAGQREITSLLRRSPEPAYQEDAAQFVSTNDRTRSSITSTIMPALSWLTSPAASAAADSSLSLDVAELLRTRGTVYLLGAEEAQTAPLVCAMTGYVAREARRLAALQPSGRLDPPLTLALDEAALICPVPLHQWTADMGGRGVSIVAMFQSLSQMRDRYGDHRTEIVLTNSAAIMLYGGTRGGTDLDYWSRLAGDRDEQIETCDSRGRVTGTTVRKVPVLTPAQLANLPAGRVVVFRRGMSPAIGSVRMAWSRRDVKGQARADRREAAAIVDAAEHVTRTTPAEHPVPPAAGDRDTERAGTGWKAGDDEH